MKSLIRTLHQNLMELRVSRDAKFLFEPNDFTLNDYIICIYYEYTDIAKSDNMIINSKLKELIDTGLIIANPTTYYTYELDEVTFYDVYLTTTDGKTFCRGTSIDRSEAYAKAFGEVFERTAIKYNYDDSTIVATQNELKYLGRKYVDINTFPKPTEKQKEVFESANYNEYDKLSWVTSINLNDKNEYYIPAQCVYFNNYINYPNEKIIMHQTTHGTGAGYNEKSATSSAIFEIINRHLFLESWYSMKVKSKINIDSIPNDTELYKMIQSLVKRGFNIHIMDYSEDLELPSVICIIERLGGWYCGGSANLNLYDAIKKSLTEAVATYMWSMKSNYYGINNINGLLIDSIQDGFIDHKASEASNRLLIYGQEYFIKNKLIFKDFIKGEIITYKTKYDKNEDFNLLDFAIQKFGNVYNVNLQRDYLKENKVYTKKIIVPTSLAFSVDEIHSRPVVDNIYPQNTEITPFP